jgi:hypothetical protein
MLLNKAERCKMLHRCSSEGQITWLRGELTAAGLSQENQADQVHNMQETLDQISPTLSRLHIPIMSS